MVDSTEISDVLRKLDTLYNNTPDINLLNWYAKLSMLEFCGWIETTMDSIVLSFSNRKLSDQKYKKHCIDILKKNHGFLYDGHFKEMLCKIIGLYNLEKLETKLGDTNIDTLNRELSTLWVLRGELAHTFTDSMKRYNTSPSAILNGNLVIILPILELIQTEIDAI
jgi:hypothetical protein